MDLEVFPPNFQKKQCRSSCFSCIHPPSHPFFGCQLGRGTHRGGWWRPPWITSMRTWALACSCWKPSWVLNWCDCCKEKIMFGMRCCCCWCCCCWWWWWGWWWWWWWFLITVFLYYCYTTIVFVIVIILFLIQSLLYSVIVFILILIMIEHLHKFSLIIQGLVNAPIEHHPTIGDINSNRYLKVIFKIPKKGHLPTPVISDF